LFRAALTVNPCSTTEGNRFVVAVMQYVVRTKVHESFPAETGHMKAHFDLALQKSHLDYKKNDLSALDWWNKYQDCAALVLPGESARRCFACNTEWIQVEAQLRAVVASSDLGFLIFGRALQSITVSKVDQVVLQSVEGFHGKHITLVMIGVARTKLLADVKALGCDAIDVYKTPKITECKYRGVSMQVACVSIFDDWNNKLWAMIKSAAVNEKKLDPLFCEDQLVDQGVLLQDTTVDAALLIDAVSARKACTQFAGTGEITSELIKALFAKRIMFLCSIDRTFKIEQLFFDGCCGTKGEQRFKSELLRFLPAVAGDKSPDQSLGALTNLGESLLSTWVGTNAVAFYQVVHSYVKSLAAGRPPKFEGTVSTQFEVEVRSRLAFFCLFREAAGSDDAGTLHTGAEAAQKLFDSLAKLKEDGEEVTLQAMQMTLTYSWLLSQHALQQLELWRKALVAAGPDVVRPGKATASRAGKTVDKKKCVGDLFKKK
jgi:hypothetical protein